MTCTLSTPGTYLTYIAEQLTR